MTRHDLLPAPSIPRLTSPAPATRRHRWGRGLATVILGALIASPAVAADTGAPALRVGDLPATMAIDGHLDETAWSAAALADAFTQVDPHEGAAPSAATHVRVLAGPRAIVIGIVCSQPADTPLASYSVRRDAVLTSEDHVRLVHSGHIGNSSFRRHG